MTVAVTPRYQNFVGSGTTGPFTFNFPILISNTGTPYITVTKIDSAGASTVLNYPADYSFVAVQLGLGGGIITTGAAIPNDGSRLFVEAATPLDQAVKYSNQGDFFPETHEKSYDKLHYIAQEQARFFALCLKIPSTDVTGTTVILPNASSRATKVMAFDADGNVIVSNLSLTALESSAATAQAWATKIDGSVDSSEYSSKAYAIGGTGVTNTSGKGAAKEWATKTSATVDTTEFSSKEYAQGSQVSTGGSAKNWAQQTGADVTGASANSRSAKSWAQDVNTGATLGGSAKDWAQTTGGTVNGTDYSAKEYAIGTFVPAGSSKNWAVLTNSFVTGTSMSAKDWAVGTFNRGSAGFGSAKDWASYTGGTVDGTDFSAKYHATAAAASAASAATSATNAANSAAAINFRYCGTAGGSANALTATPSSPLASYNGAFLSLIAASANTSGTVTINVSALGLVNIKKKRNGQKTLLAVNEWSAGDALLLQHDGTDLLLMNAKFDSQSASLAAAATLDLTASGITGNYISVTGNTGITAITLPQGRKATAVFTGTPLITNSASLINVGGKNITIQAGDIAEFVGEASGVVRMVSFMRASLGNISKINQQFFTSSGTYTPTTGMVYCIVEAVGPGGGGGGGPINAGGSGGGAGGYSTSVLTAAQIGVSQVVTIGTGGAGGAGGAVGSAGSPATSLGSLVIANGGNGGNFGVINSAVQGGIAGSAGTGNLALAGSPGAAGAGGTTAGFVFGGQGGNSYFRGGNRGGANTSGGTAVNGGAGGSGSGGGGASGGAGTATGGAGGDGLMIITEFIA